MTCALFLPCYISDTYHDILSRPCYQRVMYTRGSIIMSINACKAFPVSAQRPGREMNCWWWESILWFLARDISFRACKSFRLTGTGSEARASSATTSPHLRPSRILRMSLPLLVGGGAECGPAANNPLRGLAKNFDQDRGVQQVCIISLHTNPTLPPNVTRCPGSFGPKPRRVFEPSETFLKSSLGQPM